MESPTKRRRLWGPEDPDAELYERRARNDKKLKSRFESIFKKYSKDFSDVGDVIDFTNDEIVIDNGHIRNMANEKDPGEENHSSNGEDDDGDGASQSPLSPAEKRCSGVVPDSQDQESSDDDPLGLPEHIIGPTVSSFSQDNSIPSKNRTSQTQGRKRYPSSATWNFEPHIGLRNDFTIEEAWQVPPLPGDENVHSPSPSPSLQDDSGSAQSASPPGISIWAPIANRRRSKASDTCDRRRIPWTLDENERLRYFKTLTNLTFEDICNHFPGRTPNSLCQRWQILTQNGRPTKHKYQRNIWTQEEDQLLHRLKMSTDKTFAEIQSELTRHPINAIQLRWYKLRQEFNQSLNGDDKLPSDLFNLSSPGHAAIDVVSYASDTIDEDKQSWLDLLHSPVESNPQHTVAEREETLISLRELESDPSRSCSEDELGGPNRFPSDMVIPDSQSGDVPQHLSNQSLKPQVCFRRPFARPRNHKDDLAMETRSLLNSHLDSASATIKPKAHSMGPQSPQSILYPLKRKRILKNDRYQGHILPESDLSPRLSAEGRFLNSDRSQAGNSQCKSNPVSESSFSPGQDSNDAEDTGSHWELSAMTDSHLEYPILTSSPLCSAKPSELILNKVTESNPDMTIDKPTSASPARAEIPHNSGKGQNHDIIEITSSPLSQMGSTESRLLQFELDRHSKITSTDKAVAKHASDEPSVLETNNDRDGVVLLSSISTSNDPPFKMVTICDGSRPHGRQTPESNTKEEEFLPKPDAAREAIKISRQRSTRNLPFSDDSLLFSSHHLASDLVSRSETFEERSMPDALGQIESQPMDHFTNTFVSADKVFDEQSIMTTHERLSVEEQVQIAQDYSQKADTPDGIVVIRASEQGPTVAVDSTERILSVTRADMPTRSSVRVEKPVREATQRSVAADCQRFYRVEIPKPSFVEPISWEVKTPIQEGSPAEHVLHPIFTPSEDGVPVRSSDDHICQANSQRCDSPDLETEEESQYTEQQIQPAFAVPDMLGPTSELHTTEEIEEPLITVQTPEYHLRDWESTGK
ncbi:MAG: hypothetical protein L6R41_005416, partial [Letrouitia leprolyta]